MRLSDPLQLLILVGTPGLTLLAARVLKPVAWLGPVVICYAVGIVLSNVPGLGVNTKLSLTVSEAAVPLAIPLLLFSTDVRQWMRLARTTLVSFVLACVAAMTGAAVVGLVCRERSDEWWKMSGMLVGVYTGGTANMNAVGLALKVREETFILLNTADIIVCSVYLLFLVTVAQRVMLRFLPPFPRPTGWQDTHEEDAASPPLAVRARGMGLSLVLAVLIVGASVGTSLLDRKSVV